MKAGALTLWQARCFLRWPSARFREAIEWLTLVDSKVPFVVVFAVVVVVEEVVFSFASVVAANYSNSI